MLWSDYPKKEKKQDKSSAKSVIMDRLLCSAVWSVLKVYMPEQLVSVAGGVGLVRAWFSLSQNDEH